MAHPVQLALCYHRTMAVVNLVSLLKIANGMCGSHVVPRMRTALAEWNNMFYGCRKKMRLTQKSVDWFFADPTRPGVKFEQCQVVDVVALRVHSPPFR